MNLVHTEIVIPVHDKTRPIRRAADSVLADPNCGVIVVAHNIDPDILDIPTSDRVKVVSLNAAKGMPGATFDAGIAAATAPWVGIMGSDDWYEPGALTKMYEHAERDDADGVIAPLRDQLHKSNNLKPLTFRRKRLKAVADRMFYRTAPLGIFRSEILKKDRYAFGAIFPVGSDMRVSALLWTSGLSLSYYWDDPAYVVGRDAQTRVTFTPRPMERTLAPLFGLFSEPDVQSFSERQKHALALKIARVHVADIVRLRPNQADWCSEDFEVLCKFLQELRNFDARFDRGLAIRDFKIIQAIEDHDQSKMLKESAAWSSASFKDRVLTNSLASTIFEQDGPIQRAVSALILKARSKLEPFFRN